MAYTDINSEDRLVQATFADHLEKVLGWDSVYAWNQETFGAGSTLGRASEREVVLVRDLRAALAKLNPQLPPGAIDEAVAKLTHHDFSRSLLQHNQAFYKLIREGVPVSYRDAQGQLRHAQAAVIDFRNASNNRFLAVRELKITGLRTPNYILDHVYQALPEPPYTPDDKQQVAALVYRHIWQQSVSDHLSPRVVQ